MLTPLPPAIVRWSTVRWRRPGVKFGTTSDLSIAALSVTVMIILSSSLRVPPERQMIPRPALTQRLRNGYAWQALFAGRRTRGLPAGSARL